MKVQERGYPWHIAQTLATIGCLVALVAVFFELRSLRRDVDIAARADRAAISKVERAVVAAAEKPPAVRWEYTVKNPSDSTFDADMTAYGNEGWEVVSARRARDSYTDTMSYEVILRRPAK